MNPIPVVFAAVPDYSAKAVRPAVYELLTQQMPDSSLHGKKVMIKPNLLAWRRPGDIACVHPQVILETARFFIDQGAEVHILENPAVQSVRTILKTMGILTQLDELGVRSGDFQDFGPVPDIPEARFRTIEIAREYRSFDYVADLCKVKTHAMMTLTLCVKNLFGLVGNSQRIAWHLNSGRDFDRFADFLLDLYLAVKPQFNLADGIICMEGNGPGSGTPAPRHFLCSSRDALALDAALAPLLGVRDMPVLHRAKEREILPAFTVSGKIPEKAALKLPDPPTPNLEWGVFLPRPLRGILKTLLLSKPVLTPSRCIGCELCFQRCPPKAITMRDHKPHFDLSKCIRCYCCQEHCPKGAIMPVKPAFLRVMEKFEKFRHR